MESEFPGLPAVLLAIGAVLLASLGALALLWVLLRRVAKAAGRVDARLEEIGAKLGEIDISIKEPVRDPEEKLRRNAADFERRTGASLQLLRSLSTNPDEDLADVEDLLRRRLRELSPDRPATGQRGAVQVSEAPEAPSPGSDAAESSSEVPEEERELGDVAQVSHVDEMAGPGPVPDRRGGSSSG